MASAATTFLLPRTPPTAAGSAGATMSVDPAGIVLWNKTLISGRMDTFIGIIDTQRWICYLAPCFGIVVKDAKETYKQLDRFYEAVCKGDLLPGTPCISNSTSGADKTMVETPKSVLDHVYGEHGTCFVPLIEANFDGHSHKAMYRWVKEYRDKSVIWERCLGFAIQRDAASYYIRHASTLNEFPGQVPSKTVTTFQPLPVPATIMVPHYVCCCIPWGQVSKTIEPRDLPTAWAVLLESTLERSLGIKVTSIDMMQSRGENQMSRRARFIPGAPVAASATAAAGSGGGGASTATAAAGTGGATASVGLAAPPPPPSAAATFPAASAPPPAATPDVKKNA